MPPRKRWGILHQPGDDDNAVARQLRRSLLDYMAIDRFVPTVVEPTLAQMVSLAR